METLTYELMHQILMGETVISLTTAINALDLGYIRERDGQFVFTPKGVNALLDEINNRKGDAEHVTDEILAFHLAERCGDGSLNGQPFELSNPDMKARMHRYIAEQQFGWAEESSAYDYAVFYFKHPVTGKRHLMFPCDLIVYNVKNGFVVHNLSEED